MLVEVDSSCSLVFWLPLPSISGSLVAVGREYRMTTPSNDQRHHSPYQSFTREEWEKLRASMPQTLSEERLEALRGLNERISLHEVSQIYLPLSRLLNLYVAATQRLHTATNLFLQNGQQGEEQKVPYVI